METAVRLVAAPLGEAAIDLQPRLQWFARARPSQKLAMKEPWPCGRVAVTATRGVRRTLGVPRAYVRTAELCSVVCDRPISSRVDY
jgi:hypothetical protein